MENIKFNESYKIIIVKLMAVYIIIISHLLKHNNYFVYL